MRTFFDPSCYLAAISYANTELRNQHLPPLFTNCATQKPREARIPDGCTRREFYLSSEFVCRRRDSAQGLILSAQYVSRVSHDVEVEVFRIGLRRNFTCH